MAFDDNLKKVDEYSSLYFRDSENIFGDKKILGRRDLSKLNKKRGLVFSYIIKVDGKRYRKNFDHKDTIFNTPLEVVKKLSRELDDIKLAIKNGEPVSIRDKKFDDIYDLFITGGAGASYAEGTKKDLKSYYKNHIKPVLGHRLLSKILPMHIQEIINNVKVKGLSDRSADKTMDYLPLMFDWAIANHFCKENPARSASIVRPKYDNTVDFFLDEELMYKLYESLTTYPEAMYRGIFLFLLDGRRMSEALKMRWEYVEFEQGTYETIYTINKNRKNLDFTLKDNMRTTLDEIGIRSEGYIFYNPKTKTHFKDFRKRWKDILKDVGIDHMRIHDTRHLIGGLGVDLGFSLEQVGKVLGHQSSQSTKRYSKVRRSTADNVAREIDAAMQKKKATDKQSDLQAELISELQQSTKDLEPDELTQILEMIRSNNNG